MNKRVLVILGHPSNHSFCAALSCAYVGASRALGHDVQVLELGALNFDPLLRQGYRQEQPLEPDLLHAQALMNWAQHLVFVFPIWWGGIPALLKGFLDRVLLPGFAFKYRSDSPFPEQLLKGRSADLLVCMDTPPWYYRWVYRMPGLEQMRRTTLRFCGIRPKKTLTFGPIISSNAKQRDAWLQQARKLAGTR
ncbi:NAD(P)H-dependent oxidoreductase [Pseudomonas sp. V1]|uniref:NAD(P)H-dependent oxidoreductase n=1 Tax=Pseudomonas arcuscaelestis TaxID=2710591 RepID=UPI00193FF000|nr:NAD(P)H-dependent oxidoreductase [Pseudomonas arcuscaelestis]MBM3107481.1 NAD(P)H-dependent oxidoreductase [Pseudomonas arcuscaelestis]